MKSTFLKYGSIVLVFALLLALLAGCNNTNNQSGTPEPQTTEEPGTPTTDDPETPGEIVIKIGATPVPHAEILEIVKEELAKEGIILEIIEFTDYVQPNMALDSGDLDANFFQHMPYLLNFNENNDTNIVSAVAVHFEPLGLSPEGQHPLMSCLTGG
jgi:D-methionine transport system substrate-binding protein